MTSSIQKSIFMRINKESRAEAVMRTISEESPAQAVTHIQTIGEASDAGLSMRIDCLDCGASESVDFQVLAETRDRAMRLRDLRLSCPGCNSQRTCLMPISSRTRDPKDPEGSDLPD